MKCKHKFWFIKISFYKALFVCEKCGQIKKIPIIYPKSE